MNSCLYLVEGEIEGRINNTLKNVYMLSGKVRKIHQKSITDTFLRLISKNSIIVYIFDTDASNTFKTVKENIDKLKKQCEGIDLVLIAQIQNLEDELIFSTSIKNIKELLDSDSNSDFKADLLKLTEEKCLKKLKEKEFDINKFWTRRADDDSEFSKYENNSKRIKVAPLACSKKLQGDCD